MPGGALMLTNAIKFFKNEIFIVNCQAQLAWKLKKNWQLFLKNLKIFINKCCSNYKALWGATKYEKVLQFPSVSNLQVSIESQWAKNFL